MNETPQEPVALYRFYEGRKALYIGITNEPRRRMGEHRRGKPWFDEWTRAKQDWYPDRASALDAEERAIHRERPVYNVQHNLHVEVDIALDPEAMARNFAALAAMACAAMLAARWAADAGSYWWQKRRAEAEGRTVQVLPPRNPFTQDPAPVALTLMYLFLEAAVRPPGMDERAAAEKLRLLGAKVVPLPDPCVLDFGRER